MTDRREVLKVLTDLFRSYYYGSEPKEVFENRAANVLKNIMPNINDMEILIVCWEYTFSKSKTRKVVKERMRQVVSGVSPGNIPKWFFRILQGKIWAPSFVKELLGRKAAELLKNF